MDNVIIQKQWESAKRDLQAALANGDTEAADNLMARAKSLQDQLDGPITKAHPVSVPAARPGAKMPPAVERSAPLWQALTCRVISAIERKSVIDVMGARFPDLNRKSADALDVMVKAVQNPADTTTPGWAQELTQQAYSAFLGELARVSVFASLPLQDESFGGATSLTIPSRDQSTANPNLAAGWRKEGAPIRVGAIKTRGVKLLPFAPAVISTYSQELLQRSTPSIQRIIREAVLLDSAMMFDAKFLSADAAVADVSPAGILNGLPASNSIVSTGATGAEIAADLKHMIGVLLKSGLIADGFAWAMSSYNAMSLSMLLTATGALQFPEMASGRLIGLPFVVSANVPDSDVYLIDGASVARALPTPTFDVSTEATIHEEDTDPLPIIAQNEVPAAVPSSPVRSLYQTYSGALRCVYADLSWGILRAAPVAVLTGVDW